jgi:hypothetical protein
MKEELIEERDKFDREKRELEQVKNQERENAVVTLTLEHELELDSLRHKLEHTEKSAKHEMELAKLKEELMMKESDIEALRRKTRLLESAEKERFNCEKEKIVQVTITENILFEESIFLISCEVYKYCRVLNFTAKKLNNTKHFQYRIFSLRRSTL